MTFINGQAQFKYLPIEWLIPGPYQPRQQFSAQALEALSQSIRQQGMIEPIVVRKQGDQHYEIVAGERRWRAAQLAQLGEVPCLIRTDTDETVALLALIENLQRVDLNSIEEANAYQQLVETFNYSVYDVADQIGKSRSEVANKLSLLQLDKAVQRYLMEGLLSAGHAKVLVGLPIEHQLSLAKAAVAQAWSVRRMEQAVQRHKKGQQTHKPLAHPSSDPNLQALVKSLEEYLGLPVALTPSQTNRSGHQLKVDFYDLDVLEGFLERIGFKARQATQ